MVIELGVSAIEKTKLYGNIWDTYGIKTTISEIMG